MSEYDDLTYRHPRTMNEAFGNCYDFNDEPPSPHWFEVVLYVVKSVLSGVGLLALVVASGYLWSVK